MSENICNQTEQLQTSWISLKHRECKMLQSVFISVITSCDAVTLVRDSVRLWEVVLFTWCYHAGLADMMTLIYQMCAACVFTVTRRDENKSTVMQTPTDTTHTRSLQAGSVCGFPFLPCWKRQTTTRVTLRHLAQTSRRLNLFCPTLQLWMVRSSQASLEDTSGAEAHRARTVISKPEYGDESRKRSRVYSKFTDQLKKGAIWKTPAPATLAQMRSR